MDSWDYFEGGWNWFWGTWWPSIDWGNAPAWVGSILTSVSVSLAFIILWRDRREKRRAQADGITVWYKQTKDETGSKAFYRYTIEGYNAGSSPVPSVAFHFYNGDIPNRVFLKDVKAGDGVIGPQAKCLAAAVGVIGDHQYARGTYAGIRDSSNRYWVRDLHTGKYIGRRAFVRFQTGKLKHPKLNK